MYFTHLGHHFVARTMAVTRAAPVRLDPVAGCDSRVKSACCTHGVPFLDHSQGCKCPKSEHEFVTDTDANVPHKYFF